MRNLRARLAKTAKREEPIRAPLKEARTLRPGQCQDVVQDVPNVEVQMLELYDRMSFKDIDGGVWKQGWNIKYDPLKYNAHHKLKVFVVPHSHRENTAAPVVIIMEESIPVANIRFISVASVHRAPLALFARLMITDANLFRRSPIDWNITSPRGMPTYRRRSLLDGN